MRFSRPLRTLGLGVVTFALAFGMSACAGNVDRGALKNKMKSDPEISGIPDPALNCIVDVALKYGDKKALNSYVEGEIKLDAVPGLRSTDKKGEEDAKKCADMVK
jgi:hypothetical protein